MGQPNTFLLSLQTNNYTVSPTGAGVPTVAAKIVAKYRPGEAAVAARYEKVPDTDVGGFSLALARNLLDLDIGVLSALRDVLDACVGFTSAVELKTNVAVARKLAAGVDLYVWLPKASAGRSLASMLK
jgi:hypothetical protein